ncbi:MAG: hypothetical protein H7Z14_10050, partial [Anaerolineae bacterium]|nr:hypothetical protein [Phycisphaerae bacterium]
HGEDNPATRGGSGQSLTGQYLTGGPGIEPPQNPDLMDEAAAHDDGESDPESDPESLRAERLH